MPPMGGTLVIRPVPIPEKDRGSPPRGRAAWREMEDKAETALMKEVGRCDGTKEAP
jgi:hypothetical protein